MIYLDNSATTRTHPKVIETITNVLTHHWGNASADNSFGKDAMGIIDAVTVQVANDINCAPDEIIWTSGACEANSLAIVGTLCSNDMTLCTTKLEHTSTVEAANYAPSYVQYLLAVDSIGNIKIDYLEKTLQDIDRKFHRPFVSISYASSEIGVIQDIKSIAAIVHAHDGLLHVDATQMYPWCKIDVQDLGIDLMSVSGQKLNCVKGIGFLYIRDGINVEPIIYGSQQSGRRGGTYPTHLIAAFGKALELRRQHDKWGYVADLRDELLDSLLKIDGVHLNGPEIAANRLPNNISLTIDGVKAETLTTMCDLMGVIIAKGSACKSHEPKPSDTLLAIGLTPEQALNTIRISLDGFNTFSDVWTAADIITKLVERIRQDG